jgi:hypothetical protein
MVSSHGKNHPRFIQPAPPAEKPAPRRLVAGIPALSCPAVCEITAKAERPAQIKTWAEGPSSHRRPLQEMKPCRLRPRPVSKRRALGFRAWRLERYFAKTPAERLISPDSGKG